MTDEHEEARLRRNVMLVAAAQRGLARFSISEIAALSGCSYSSVRDVLGGRPAGRETRRRVLDAIGIGVEDTEPVESES